MASKGQMTGMLGVYLVAVELTKRGFIVSPTSRSAMGADLLVTDQGCERAFSVQVKTNARRASFWLAGNKKISSPSHIYIFVNARPPRNAPPEFFIVPSRIVAKNLRATGWGPTTYSYVADVKFKDSWKAFGKSGYAA